MGNRGEATRLITVSGPATGEVFLLTADEVVAGRDAANAVAIPDPSLSRKHCAFARSSSGWSVRDLGSFNGTLVNGEPAADHPLRHGDRVRIGASELLFHDASATALPPRGPTPSNTTSLRLADSVYLEHAGNRPSASRTEHDLQALVHLGTAVSRILQRDQLQRTLLETAFNVVPAADAAFVRVDAGTERHVIDTRTRHARDALPPSQTVLDLAISRREAILTNEPEQTFQSAASVTGPGLSSILAVPILDGEEVAAVLYLVTDAAGPGFDRQHLELVTAIAAIGSIALKNVTRLESLYADTERLKQQRGITHGLIGTSGPMRRVYDFIEKASRSDATVLITGETGTGKELAARALHDNSRRADCPFVAINCAALTETLQEAELFGYERGAFTGAASTKRGKLEVADRGTVFLDEVGELSPVLQAKLLRALQQREFDRVGGTRPIKVDIRVISATNRDLEKEVTDRRFRQDLLFRLKVLTLHMPPLRDRRQDVPGLAAHFGAQAARRSGRRTATFTAAALRRLVAYDWPGNVRELENVVERAVVLSTDPDIGPDDLPEILTATAEEESAAHSRFHAAVAEAKRRIVRDAIDEADGRLTDAARLLGLNANYLHRLLRNLKLRD